MKRIFYIVFLVIVLIAPVSTAMAEGAKTYFSGTTCSNLILENGEEWVHGVSAHIIGLRDQYDYDLSDDRISGHAYVTINANFTNWYEVSGPLWGTLKIKNEDGTWSGPWTGISDNFVYTIHGVLHGSGAYEGLVAYYDQYRPGLQLCMDVFGYIVETRD